MSKLFYKSTQDAWRPGDNGSVDAPSDAEVNEQHPLPQQLLWRSEGQDEWQPVDEGSPLPVSIRQGHALDWRQRLILLGYGGHISIGAASTPITGGGNGTVYDLEQPEGVISVASGYTLVPLRITVQCHVPLLATDADESEILVAADVAAAWPGTGTKTDETVFPMLTRGSAPGGVVAASAFTGDTSTPTLGMELDRSVITGDVQGTPASALWTPLALLYEPVTPPLIQGPAAIYIYWGGTVATTGFAQAAFLSVPNAVLAGLL